MNSLRCLPLWFSLMLVFSCQSSNRDTEALRAEVIAIHDEVMPLMGNLKFQERRLKGQLEESDPPHDVKYLEEVIGDLQEAYEGMFVWMRQFQSQQGEMNDEEWEAYLMVQKEKVESVNSDIKNALARAKALE